MIDVKKMYMIELIRDECKQDPDSVFNIPILWIRIRLKMDRILNSGEMNRHLDPKHWYP